MTQTVFITSPLEQVHVERIRALDRNVHVLHAPELLPRTRYVSDHHGAPFERSPPQQERFHAMMAEADILWDLPTTDDLEGSVFDLRQHACLKVEHRRPTLAPGHTRRAIG